MRIVCFGDSNTFGFDPRSFIGGRYPASSRWPDLLAEKTGYEVINDGENGRSIPVREGLLLRAERMITRQEPDLLVMMLGVNDLLEGADPPAIAGRMEKFLDYLPDIPTLLIGPPQVREGTWVPDEQTIEDSAEVARLYGTLAARLGIHYADARDWDIELAYDGVHFTEKGHADFAEEIAKVIEAIIMSW